jgi:glycosyltransferase involved in cell wall biosynthesis
VRIGIVMLGNPAMAGRDGEITAYSRRLAEGLVRRDPGHDFVLYAADDLAPADLPAAARCTVSRPGGESSLSAWLDRLAHEDPDRLDWLILLDPFDARLEQGPPVRPLVGPRVAAVVHDLFPFLFQERVLPNPVLALSRYRTLERIKRYNALLVPSESTRSDCLRLLGLPPERVHAVGVGGDRRLAPPDRSEPLPVATRRELFRVGIRRSFVLALAGPDGRTNLAVLVQAFLALPDRLRRGCQLVIAGPLSHTEADPIRASFEDQRLRDALVLTGALSDETLGLLVQRCAVFVSPSTFEGIGLSIVEALCCGAVVIAGHNTAQPEVVGDAGLLVNASNALDLAAKLEQALDDGLLSGALRQRALARAGQLTWEETAGRVLDALRQPPASRSGRRLRADLAHAWSGESPAHSSKPRIAFFSPLPPKISGISDYAVRLLNELKKTYTIDLYHDAGYVPDLGLSSSEFGCFDYRLFDRRDAALGYHQVVYQMGNSVYHGFLYETLQRRPGVVTLHDFCIASFQYWYAHVRGWGIEGFRREVAANIPHRADELLAELDTWQHEEGGIQSACARRGVFLNRRIFECSRGVAVHSPWCAEQVRHTVPEYAE